MFLVINTFILDIKVALRYASTFSTIFFIILSQNIIGKL